MRRSLFVLMALIWLARAASAQPVEYRSGNETVRAYLARPGGGGPHPAIVVIHEWWGLNEWAREQADALAKQGYVALAVDLYRGKATADRDEAHELSRGLPRDRARRDLKAAVDFLAARRDVSKVGVIGWCMGGGLSLELAIADARILACVVVYGSVPTDASEVQALQAPVLGIFGTDDRGIDSTRVRQFWSAMSEAKKRLELHEFLAVGHAFMNPDNKSGYNAEATETAQVAIRVFLARFLK